MSENPFAKENNPFSSGDQAPDDEADSGNPFEPGAMPPPAEPETTKPRQMPGGGEAPQVSDPNVPQESGPPLDKTTAYIRHTNPHLAEATVHRLARKVASEFGGPNPLSYGMTTFEDRQWGKQPNQQLGDLNDPYNSWSPLNREHPDYDKHQGKQPWEVGDLNDKRNVNSPLHPRHPLNHHYMRSGLFNQQSTVRQSSLDSLVEFFAQD